MAQKAKNQTKEGLFYSIEELAQVFDRSERQIHRWLKKWEEHGHHVATKTVNRKKLYYLPHVLHYWELSLLEAFGE